MLVHIDGIYNFPIAGIYSFPFIGLTKNKCQFYMTNSMKAKHLHNPYDNHQYTISLKGGF